MRASFRMVLFGLAILTVAGSLSAGTIAVEAWIDGRSQLILKGNTAQWYHLDFTAPGRGGVTYPTVINGVDWFPVWPGDPGNPNNSFCNCFSDVFTGVNPPLPASALPVTLNIVQARAGVSILQQPSSGNDYELIVEFNDNGPGGAAWYLIELQTADPIPAASGPGAALLALLIAAAAVIALRARLGTS
ncbi:MAG: hypothetical protein MUE90_07075 [Thermoanaerobaculales bacterium]|nr:hypothetical protein [Thermoanaerobaculales bacterium]